MKLKSAIDKTFSSATKTSKVKYNLSTVWLQIKILSNRMRELEIKTISKAYLEMSQARTNTHITLAKINSWIKEDSTPAN